MSDIKRNSEIFKNWDLNGIIKYLLFVEIKLNKNIKLIYFLEHAESNFIIFPLTIT